MAFPESFLQELAERNDIVDVVSSYVRLTKKSGSNLFGLCPFHSEKTPSFSVSTGAERRRGGRLFMDIEGDLLIVTAAEYAEVNWNKDTTYYTIFPPGREG